jgi:hypothetical protein
VTVTRRRVRRRRCRHSPSGGPAGLRLTRAAVGRIPDRRFHFALHATFLSGFKFKFCNWMAARRPGRLEAFPGDGRGRPGGLSACHGTSGWPGTRTGKPDCLSRCQPEIPSHVPAGSDSQAQSALGRVTDSPASASAAAGPSGLTDSEPDKT